MKGSSQHAFEPEEVMAYLDGELQPQQAAALATHLEHCTECQAVAAELRHVSERMLDFQAEPCPAKLEEPIVAALNSSQRDGSAKLSFWIPKRRRILRNLAWMAGCVVVVLAIVAVPTLHRSRYAAEFSGQHATRLAVADQVTNARGRSYAHLPSSPVPPPPATPVPTDGIIGGVPGNGSGGSIGKLQSTEAGEGIEAPGLRGPMIVQTASITIVASNYDQASAAIEVISKQHGGYIQDMTADSRTGMARSVSATLRIPDSQLEAALSDLRKIGHVEQETRNNQEITDQYIDLTARLKSARATEQRIRELLATRTGRLSDVLQAEQELARIRGEIESMDGQRATMEHQVRYATVQLQLNELYVEQLHSKAVTTATLLHNSLVDGLRNLVDGAIWLLTVALSYGPSGLFWLAVFGTPAWLAWRRYRRSRAASPTEAKS